MKTKKDIIKLKNDMMLNKTVKMFNWKNLPKTTNSLILEKQLQTNGTMGVIKQNEEIYFLRGGLGGMLDYNFIPTQYIISNPYLSLDRNVFEINKNCVLLKNDTNMMGLKGLFNYYNNSILETEISARLLLVNMRASLLISASDDNTKRSAEEFLKKLNDGEQGIIGDDGLLESLKVHQSSNTYNGLTNLIEYLQYNKAMLLNELGIQSNFNMKRERLNTDEVNANLGELQLLVNNMLEERKIAIEKINEMFKTNISVELSETWSIKKDEETEEVEEVKKVEK